MSILEFSELNIVHCQDTVVISLFWTIIEPASVTATYI